MSGAQALYGCQSFKNAATIQKTVLAVGGGCLRRDANGGDGNKGGRQATATRAMAMAMATTTTWAMARVMRLAGDKESEKGQGQQGQ